MLSDDDSSGNSASDDGDCQSDIYLPSLHEVLVSDGPEDLKSGSSLGKCLPSFTLDQSADKVLGSPNIVFGAAIGNVDLTEPPLADIVVPGQVAVSRIRSPTPTLGHPTASSHPSSPPEISSPSLASL